MTDVLRPDLCVIGAGSGGLSVAAAAAAFGVSVVLIERDEMGGDCLNTGCVPSKALIAAGAAAQSMREASRYGIASVTPDVDFAAVMAHVRGVIETIAPHDSEERFTGLGVTVLRGTAAFADDATVVVDGRRIMARRFVIATGSRPVVPPIPGLADGPFLTNETVFGLDRRPDHLLVLGGGPIGCEMAQAFRRLGSEVTLIEADRILAREDPEAVAVVTGALVREGVRLEIGARVTAVTHRPDGITLTLEGHDPVVGTHLLVAVGRKPTMDGLALDRAGVETGRAGIVVDGSLRSVSNRRVYAVGDIAGQGQFTHLAAHHAAIVVRNALFRLPGRHDVAPIPAVTYTDPELGRAGLDEASARAAHGDVRVLTAPFAGNDRAVTERATEGFVKLLVTGRGRIVGATVVGDGAGDLIATLQLAIAQRMPVRAFLDTVLPYPTRAEAIKRAALGQYAAFPKSGWVRSVLGLLRRLG